MFNNAARWISTTKKIKNNFNKEIQELKLIARSQKKKSCLYL